MQIAKEKAKTLRAQISVGRQSGSSKFDIQALDFKLEAIEKEHCRLESYLEQLHHHILLSKLVIPDSHSSVTLDSLIKENHLLRL